jgi:NitT/TauT family transport system substrate-binding protein
VIGSPYTEVQAGVEVGQYITTTAFTTQNAEVVAKFVRALRKGIAWYNANMTNPELFQMVAELTKMPVDRVKQLPPQEMPSKIDVAQVQKTIELMREHGILTSSVDTAKFMHPIAIND